jgi:phage shock protein PspC (stress-responsive transcriptional regulator)
MPEQRKFYRNRSNRMVAGICSGLAHYFSLDPLLVRLVFVALALVNGLGFLIYLIMWIIVPDETNQNLSGEDIVHANLQDMSQQAKRIGRTLTAGAQGRSIVGIALVVLGGLFLLQQIVPHFHLGLLWPVALIAVGIYIIVAWQKGR